MVEPRQSWNQHPRNALKDQQNVNQLSAIGSCCLNLPAKSAGYRCDDWCKVWVLISIGSEYGQISLSKRSLRHPKLTRLRGWVCHEVSLPEECGVRKAPDHFQPRLHHIWNWSLNYCCSLVFENSWKTTKAHRAHRDAKPVRVDLRKHPHGPSTHSK